MRSLISLLLDVVAPRKPEVLMLERLTPGALAEHACPYLPPPPCVCAPLSYRARPVRAAVHQAKYHGNKRAAELLGRSLASFLLELIAERRMFGEYERVAVIPIPLCRARLRERGYNQSERIAHALLTELDDSSLMLSCGLVRTKNTPSQTTRIGRAARFRNMRAAFEADRSAVEGRDIILLDDVVTTGATLAAAERALVDAGARSVLCVAVAQ